MGREGQDACVLVPVALPSREVERRGKSVGLPSGWGQ